MAQLDSWTTRLTRRLQSAQVLQHPVPDSADLLLAMGLPLCFAGYFVARGWLNAALVLAFAVCLVGLLRDCAGSVALLRQRPLRWMLFALAAPFAAVLLTQLVHQEFVPRAYDSALRILMAGVVLWYLLLRRINFLPLAERVLPVAVLACAAAIFLYPDAAQYFWDNRFATYFIDPLTLGQHITIVGFMCLFCVDASRRDGHALRLLKYAAFMAAIAVSIGTQSRSAWVIVPVLAGLWLIGLKRCNNPPKIGLALLAVLAACLLLYACSPIIQLRANEAVAEYAQYFNGGNRDTSPGLRLSMWRANWLLFLEHPVFGWGFSQPVDLQSVPHIRGFWTPMFETWYTKHGGHNEILSSMMHTGVFGLASRVLVFAVPLLVFANASRSLVQRRRVAGFLGLALVLGYLVASINTEVFNLVYIASFYGLLVAALASTALYREADEPV